MSVEFDLARELSSYGPLSNNDSVELHAIGGRPKVADGTSQFLLNSAWIVKVSPAAYPHVARDEAHAIAVAKQRLAPDLGKCILDVSATGLVDGRTFLVLPRCTPLSSNRILFLLQKKKLQAVIFSWLRGIAGQCEAPSAEATQSFRDNLEKLRSYSLPDDVQRAIGSALKALSEGALRPRFVPMHGDLWKGNILFDENKAPAIIDWRGSQMRGFGIFDLVRFAGSVGCGSRILRNEVTAHASVLGTDYVGAGVHLLAALGFVGSNLGQMPPGKFIQMAMSCWQVFATAAEKF